MNSSELQQLIQRVPYAQTIGIVASDESGCFLLPVKKTNIGNPTLPALHGGALAGFMELSAMIHVLQLNQTQAIPKVVDFSVDFVRAGRYVTTHSRCKLVYLGRRMMNVGISAWQEDEASPIAMARAQFLVKA
ncbi:Uncharacterised protein [Zhongshania aliphaticivorans]|uniref:Thioesterase domain-containing protein n=1 Tax=Zhongshania aliphaticivorans TaxID=1470434 RepID=A0A5S9PW25_9GAMM|nr:PaaI family thioesterase [Zhongshania aliphaticivorans]CAA0109230.1 Uncharacterised protein [Zhongshania aliphaticivorans]CAA0117484.1 Uncharacterised protein [Zhongshania aliphaticivorans]